MTAPVNRVGRVAVIVTAREYQALLSASTLAVDNVGWSGDEGNDKRDVRALATLLSKCRDAGIRTTYPPDKSGETHDRDSTR